MKKKHRVLKGIIIGVIVLAIVGAGVLYVTGAFGGSGKASTTPTYQVSKLRTGDLQESVSGTGSMESGDTEDVTAPFALTLDKIKVEAGQSVKKGDTLATVDEDSVGTTIASLQSQIESLDSQLARQLKSEDSTTTVKANIKGRVKKIMVEAGDDVKTAMEKYGGLMVLSTDEKMRVDIKLNTANSVAIGDEVTVKTGGDSYDGTVESLSDDGKTCTVTLTDNGPELNATATVYNDGKKIGSGKLAINQPITVTATAGTIEKVKVSLNKRVYASSSLVKLENVPYSQTYTQLADERKEYATQLKEALLIQKSGTITADQDGIINTITATDGAALKEDAAILAMYIKGATALKVSVDELDITKVAVGQSVSIAMDAISGKTFEGKVTAISAVGATSNGVTTYPVTVSVADDGNLKIGMSATATIVIQSHTNVLELPIEALQTSRGKYYVWKYTGSFPTDSTKDPGERTEVEIGLSNDNYVEITSGLTSNDQVVIVRTKSVSGSGNQYGGGMEMGGMPGGGMPGGFSGANRSGTGGANRGSSGGGQRN